MNREETHLDCEAALKTAKTSASTAEFLAKKEEWDARARYSRNLHQTPEFEQSHTSFSGATRSISKTLWNDSNF